MSQPLPNTHNDPADCAQVFALLSEYLDMELTGQDCAEFEAHMAGCQECVEFIATLRQSSALARQYEPDELPAPLSEAAKEELAAAYKAMLAAREK